MKSDVRASLLALVCFGLAACGGGTTGATASSCAKTALLTTLGATYSLTSQTTGIATLLRVDSAVVGLTSFNGSSAYEVVQISNGGAIGGSTLYENINDSGWLVDFGYSTDVARVTSTVTFDPAFVNSQFGLVPGESTTISYNRITTSDSSTTTVSGSETFTFVGRESVSVPAGTFSTCKFQWIDSAQPNQIKTQWLIDGYGLAAQEAYAIGGVVSTTKATAIVVNGKSL